MFSRPHVKILGLAIGLILLSTAACHRGSINFHMAGSAGAWTEVSGHVQADDIFQAGLTTDCTSPKEINLLRLGEQNDKDTVVATAPLAGDGGFTFSQVELSPASSYLLLVSGCNVALSRVVAGPKDQNVTPGTTVVSYGLSSIKSFANLAQASGRLGEFDQILKALEASRSSLAAYQQLNDSPELRASFADLFGFDPAMLMEAPPWVLSFAAPASVLAEDQTMSFGISVCHWHPDYKTAYLWQVDETTIGAKANGSYTLGGDSQGLHTLSVFVGQKNADGSLDRTKPFTSRAVALKVTDSTVAAAPLLKVKDSGALTPPAVRQRTIELLLSTGVALKNCESFSALALTEGTATPPGVESAYNLKCTDAPEQTIPFTLADGSDGLRMIRTWSRDSAGNVSARPQELAVRLKRIPPSFSSLSRGSGVSDGLISAARHLTPQALVAGLQGSDYDSAGYRIVAAAAACDGQLSYQAAVPLTTASELAVDGVYKVCAALSDDAGNPVAYGASPTFTVKTVLPTFHVLPLANDAADGIVDIAEHTLGTHDLVDVSSVGSHYDQAAYTIAAAATVCDSSLTYTPTVPLSTAAELSADGLYKVCAKLTDAVQNPPVYGASPNFALKVHGTSFVSLVLAGDASGGYLGAAAHTNSTLPLVDPPVGTYTAADYSLVPSSTTCGSGLSYGAAIPRSNAAELTSDDSYHVCVRLSDPGTSNPVSYGGSASFVLKTTLPNFGSLALANDAANSYINTAEHSGSSLALVDLPVGTGFTAAAYALVSSTTSCSGPLAYTAARPTSDSTVLSVDGSYKVCVRLDDGANPSVYGASPALTLALTPPTTFAVTAPGAYATTVTPTVTWSAATSALSVSYDLKVSASSTCSSPVQTYTGLTGTSQALTALAEGSYYICVTASDPAGNTRAASAQAVTIDVTPPGSFSLTAPAASSYAVTSTPTVTWGSASGAATYDLKIGSASGCASPVESHLGLTTTSQTTGTLTDGVYYLCLSAKDAAGNQTAASNDNLSFTVDTQAPAAPAVTRTSTSPSNTAALSLTLSSCADTSAVFVAKSATPPGLADSGWQTCSTTSNAVTYTYPSPAAGTNSFYVWARDLAGHISATSTALSFVYDTTAPVITTAVINNDAAFTATVFVSMNVAASDDMSALYIRVAPANASTGTCDFVDSGWKLQTGATGSYVLQVTSGDGTKKACAWAKDAAGNVSAATSDTIQFEVGNIPVITSFSAVNDQAGGNFGTTSVASGEPILLSWTTTDAEGLADDAFAISYTTDYVHWLDLITNNDTSVTANITWFGSTSGHPMSYTGSYNSFVAPTSGFLRFRLQVRDYAGNMSLPVLSDLLNANSWSSYAGSIAPWLGGLGTSATISSPYVNMSAIDVDPVNGDLYTITGGGRVLKLDAQTGLTSMFITSGTTNLPNSGALPATPAVSGGVTFLRFGTDGYLYLSIGGDQRYSAIIYRLDPRARTCTRYFGGGSVYNETATPGTAFLMANTGFDIDESNSIYYFASCNPGSWAPPATTLRLMKVTQVNGAADTFSIVAGNCVAGSVVNGSSALTSPIRLSSGEGATAGTIAVRDNGHLVFFNLVSGSDVTLVRDGQIYVPTGLQAMVSYALPFRFNRFDNKLYFLRSGVGLVRADVNTNGVLSNLATLASSTGSGESPKSCVDDGILGSHACINTAQEWLYLKWLAFAADGTPFFSDGTGTSVRVRYISSAGKVQTALGSLPFAGLGLNKGVIKGSYTSIYYKNSGLPNETTFPAGLYFSDGSGGIFARIDPTTGQTVHLFGNQSQRNILPTAGQAMSPTVEFPGYTSTGLYQRWFNFSDAGLPWLVSNNRILSIGGTGTFTIRSNATRDFWDPAATPATLRVHDTRAPLFSGFAVTADGVFMTGNPAWNGLNNNVLEYFDYTAGKRIHVMGNANTSAFSADCSTPGCSASATFVKGDYNGYNAPYPQYSATEARLYFFDLCAASVPCIRYVDDPISSYDAGTSQTTSGMLKTLTTLPVATRGFTLRPDGSQLFYISETDGRLYCKNLTSSASYCSAATPVGPPSPMLQLGVSGSSIPMTWEGNSKLYVVSGGEIVLYQAAAP